MKTIQVLILVLCLGIPLGAKCDPILFLNEVSQGTQPGQEYVEFAVQGGCPGGPVNLDIRHLIIDDNNGLYSGSVGANASVSNGALRFASIPLWQYVPQGTLIVIYNEENRNPALPPDDFSTTDGNGMLVLPANSIYLEGQGATPTPTNSNYSGPWVAGAGLWAYVAMDDAGDTFRLQASWTPYFWFTAVSWGNNTGVLQIPDQYFSNSATGLVFYVDAHVAQGGWLSGPAAISQTPGLPNSPLNHYWIYQSMEAPPLQLSLTSDPETCFGACNAFVYAQPSGGTVPYSFIWNVPAGNVGVLQNQCPGTYSLTATDGRGCQATAEITIEPAEEIVVAVSLTNETCSDACDGSITVTPDGGNAPFSASWSNGSSGLSLTGLCPDYYQVVIEDSLGCTVEIDTAIYPGNPAPTSAFANAGPFQENSSPFQLQNSVPGGEYTTNDCTGCLTPAGIFSPGIAGIGTFNICYTLTLGTCSSVQCQQITVTPCTPIQTAETIYICKEDSIQIFGNWQNQQDIFAQSFPGAGCDSIHRVTLMHHSAPDLYTAFSLCEGDSVQVFGSWTDSSGVFGQEMQTSQGCRYIQYITVVENFCPEEAYIYIPNAFTPDGDQVNDVFTIEMLGAIIVEGYILNRWGEIVARFDENNPSWNGNNEQGKPVPDGVYVYYVKCFTVEGVNEEKVGHVTLLR